MRLTQQYLIGTILSILLSALITLLGIFIPLSTFEADTIDYLVNEKNHTIDVFFQNSIKNLTAKAVEYAYWDDLIAALSVGNIPWIKENVTEYLFHSPFHIDLVYLTSDIYNFYDFYSDGPPLEQVKNINLLQRAKETDDPSLDFISLDGQLYMVAVSPIKNNTGTLAPQGFLLMGRKMSREVLNPLLDYIGDNVSIQEISTHPSERVHHIKDNERLISFYHTIYDFEERPIKSYQVTIDMGRFYRLRYILFRNITWIVGFSVLLCSLIVYRVAKKLSNQFEHVVDAIRHIADGDYNQKLEEYQTYELKILSQSINKLSSNIHHKTVQMQENYLKTIETLSAAIEVKDQYTMGHSQRVADYSAAIASALGVQDVNSIQAAALMHDIGKIGIPEYILNKHTKLTPEELSVIQEHPEKGYRILDIIDDFHEIKYMIRYHHEWYNGKGYPHGLSGEDIPIGARIIAVADAFDAMTSHRPYRKALSFDYALAEMNKMAGIQFDPKIIRVFNEIVWNIYQKYSMQEVATTFEE
ncbi:HD domain-containing phosphohydrolase [Thermotalea metallivorans]|uniref:Cyclic di-GMP phosphodiesterase response regulator RpfG n=1 Tax=Thermotalea metallivorans TaxID=520762 RepID=A0A140L361_9FIRM|nr:HD domain-containing phosphohydrolase [Thermotalea metallivorans]KXG74986.1 Cyclic di-GMP phosphodiesterase response regulator RpfG [Thermotalea metallivorans]